MVVDRIVIPKDTRDFSYPLIAFLSCRIDQKMQVISFVYSVIEKSPLYFSSTNYLEIRETRRCVLQEREIEFQINSESLDVTYNLSKNKL